MSAPSAAPTDWVPISSMGTGSAPKFRLRASSRASSGVNVPVITALPAVISDWITGSVIGTPSRNIASISPMLSPVICAKSSLPSLLKFKATTGSLETPGPLENVI